MIIPLHFINYNHFEIIYSKNCIISNLEIPFNKKNWENKIKNLNIKYNNHKIPNLFINEYIFCNKCGENKYNEIFNYLKNKIIPKRIESIKDNKKRQKKEIYLEKCCNNYNISENRLWYKYKFINKNHKKKIIKKKMNIKNVEVNKNNKNENVPLNEINIEKEGNNESVKINNQNNNLNKMLRNFKDINLNKDNNNNLESSSVLKNLNIDINIDINTETHINLNEKKINYKWKKIPFNYETDSICYNIP